MVRPGPTVYECSYCMVDRALTADGSLAEDPPDTQSRLPSGTVIGAGTEAHAEEIVARHDRPRVRAGGRHGGPIEAQGSDQNGPTLCVARGEHRRGRPPRVKERTSGRAHLPRREFVPPA